MSENSSALETESRIIRPFRAGMPNLRQYFIDIRNRKEFVLELSRAERAEEHLDTVFGQLWSVLSPLLSAGVYYLFIFVVQGGHQGTEFFLHLVAGIFIFTLMTYIFRDEAITMKTGISLLLAFSLIIVQLFWK